MLIVEDRYKRLSDESYDDYWWRICENKFYNIYPLTWEEVGLILNQELGEDFSPHKWRKSYQAMKKGYEKAFEEGNDIDLKLEKLELKKLELKNERVKLSSLRNDLNKKVSNRARFELWIDELKDAIPRSDIDIPNFKPLHKDNNKEEYLVCVSDIHTGKRGESLNNYYDLDVMQNRMWQLRDELIELIESEKISNLKVLFLGDLIDGLLRASQLQKLQISRAEQTVFVTRFLFEWVNSLTEYCNIEVLMTTSSNHSQARPLNSNRDDFADDDYEVIIYNWLEDLVKLNNRITLKGSPVVEFEIADRKCVALHGHQTDKIRKGNPLSDISFHMNKQYQYLFMGHLHHTEIKSVGENELGNKEVIYCPSLCGSDDYSDKLWVGAKAGALVVSFNKKQGRRSITDIVLD